MNTRILYKMQLEANPQAERRYLCALWLDPIHGHDCAAMLGLSGRDFLGTGHSLVFCYVCNCAELGRVPSADEVLKLSPNVFGDLSAAALDAILHTPVNVTKLTDYAQAVREAADDRWVAELRALIWAGVKEWSEFQRWLASGGQRVHKGSGRRSQAASLLRGVAV